MKGWPKNQLEAWLSRTKTAEYRDFVNDTIKMTCGGREIHCHLSPAQQVALIHKMIRGLQREASDGH